MNFFVACVPPKTTSQQKGAITIGGKPRFFKKKAAKEAEASFDTILASRTPQRACQGPLRLLVEVTWPWRANTAKKVKALGRAPHTTRPDCSNWIKMFEDALVRWRFIEDDALIADLQVRKYWGDQPGILCLIEEIE